MPSLALHEPSRRFHTLDLPRFAIISPAIFDAALPSACFDLLFLHAMVSQNSITAERTH